MNNIVIIILETMIFYINENKIYNVEYLYEYMMSIYFTIIFVFMFWTFIKINFFKYKNKLNDYIYANIYDYFFGNKNFSLATPNLFLHTIKKLEPNTRILDFGCGSGICYSNLEIKNTIINKNIKIQGIDIDKAYVEKCKKRIQNEKLFGHIDIKLQDIFKYNVEQEYKFDYIVFSESAPLLSTELIILIVKYMIANLLKPNGKIIFINNLTENSTPIMRKIKPFLKYITMIDFGRVLTLNEFENLSRQVNKNIKVNLIASMKIIDILNYFNLRWTYYLVWKNLGIKNYNVEQYEIILNN